ncbi:DUF3139 domain-containing protein [Paenibacillus oralis]|uniref:DUF3139 domain-containing protein n=1 Tax=Paenibacillus oralis TaxID=2490856 RepID=A0A3P3U600_9BACL|nr:DUF3139 domain-containing protein [Paenibacillus oralis]RRJ65801.1 DUF3139 domain-containing protein [Paenibacillus oralis]
MKKTIIVCSVILVILLIVGTGYFMLQSKLNRLEDSLLVYLVHEKKYQEDDIALIEAHWGKMPALWVNVTFADEPSNTYVYTDRGNNTWVQIGPTVSDLEQGEVYKHYVHTQNWR